MQGIMLSFMVSTMTRGQGSVASVAPSMPSYGIMHIPPTSTYHPSLYPSDDNNPDN